MHVHKRQFLTALGTAVKLARRDKHDHAVAGLRAEGGDLRVSVAGDAVAIDIPVMATGLFSAPAAVDLNPAPLLDFLRRSTGTDVDLTITAQQVQVTCAGVTAQFKCAPGALPISRPPVTATGTVGPQALLSALSSVRHAAAARAGQGQAAYRGVLLEARGSVLQVIATDGHQLAIRAVAWQGDPVRLLVRLSDLWTLMSALSLVSGEVTTLQVSEQSLLLDGTVQARVQLMDERAYPDFRTVIPSGHRPNLHVDADAFRAALRSVSTILSADDMVSMRATPLGLSLHAATPTARAAVPVTGAQVHAPFEVTTRTRMLHLALLADGELALTAVPGRTTLMLTSGPFLALMTRAAEVQTQVPPPVVPLDGRAPWEAVVASGQPVPDVTWDAVGRP